MSLLAASVIFVLADGSARAQVREATLNEATLQPMEAEPAYPPPSTPLPADSEFETAPSSYVEECQVEGLYYDAELEYALESPIPRTDSRCPMAGSSFDGLYCFVATPPAGTSAFVWSGNLYTSPKWVSGAPTCPIGSYDGANCYVGTPPNDTQGFVWDGKLYHTPYYADHCPSRPFSGSGYDGANCFVATPAANTQGFVWEGKLYTTPLRNQCPTGSYDGANCRVATIPSTSAGAYVSGNRWYYYSTVSYCAVGTKIGTWGFSWARCDVGAAPSGSPGPFIYGTGFYYTPLLATLATRCPLGSWDGANCYVMTPPAGTAGFVYAGKLYYTKFLGPVASLWGAQERIRGKFATIYVHGRNSCTTSGCNGPIIGFGYSSWANRPKGDQPVWLGWDSTQRLNDSMAAVRSNLDAACRGPQFPCQVVCHSAGCLMITRQLSENPGRWNVATVTAIMGAQGGSEIANIGAAVPQIVRDFAAYYLVYKPIDVDLTTWATRNMFNHHQTSGAPIVTASGHFDLLDELGMTPAESCSWWMWIIASPYCVGVELWNSTISSINTFFGIFPGGHDGVLAYHSTAGFSAVQSSWNSCSPTGSYWTNYDSVHRRGNCYEGKSQAFHMDGWKLLDDFGTIPP